MGTRFIVYGIKEPSTGKYLYVGMTTNGLIRPYRYFYEPETCHNPGLKSWIISLNERRFFPQEFVEVLEFASNKDELRQLEAKYISGSLSKNPLFNKVGAKSDGSGLYITCDAEIVAQARSILAERRISLDEFVSAHLIAVISEKNKETTANGTRYSDIGEWARRFCIFEPGAKSRIGHLRNDPAFFLLPHFLKYRPYHTEEVTLRNFSKLLKNYADTTGCYIAFKKVNGARLVRGVRLKPITEFFGDRPSDPA